MRILLIEDDPQAARYITRGLREAGHVLVVANNGADGLSMASDEEYDVLIIDRMLPSMDGLSIVQSLREQDNHAPVLILSALGDLEDRVSGLRAGGDDYLPKPFAFEELLARVEALGRRPNQGNVTTHLTVADLKMDILGRKVQRADKPIVLQPREFRLLEYLMRHSGQVVTRTMLLENVWDYHFDPQTNVIDVHVSRLRAKIDRDFEEPLLYTVRGAGYMLREPE
ncbi:MAG TPA: DNA-binding response regulator [Gammaproteobacteria bacterium]|nr:DNA-binding response regulator [Gammaproteobacteria bacterium]|tara:strand:- start:247 stop:924 length:678 start_codon:yes stop_codon:yes gene_type:complete